MNRTERDCAARGADTISRVKGCINDEMRECVACGHACRWDMTEQPFFGFASSCPFNEDKPATPPLETAVLVREPMTRRKLLSTVRSFRNGMLGGESSDRMCFAVCAALQGYLGVLGIKTKMVKALFPRHETMENHVWLEMEDGNILDPTADQFGLPAIYLGPIPTDYILWMRP